MKNFGIILGEPNSINSEILAKSIAYKKKAVIIGNYNLLKLQLKILKIKKRVKKFNKFEDFKKKANSLNVLDVPLKFKKAFSVSPKESSVYIKKCLALGHELCLQRKIGGIINCSINKRNVFKNKNLGVTEFLAKKNNIYNSEVMIIYNKKFSVVPLTTHIKVKEISKLLKKKLIINKIDTLNKFYFRYFNIRFFFYI